MINEREKLIGARLRAFRETLQIPRSRFAVTIGFGSDRIASYEAGRAPLLYEVFRAALGKYSLSPQWLATGVGSPKWPDDNKDFILEVVHSPRDLFSSVYEERLADSIAKQVKSSGSQMEKTIRHLNLFCESLKGIDRDSAPEEFVKKVMEMNLGIEEFAEKLRDDIKLRQKARLRILQNEGLTDVPISGNSLTVKVKLPALLKRLNEATKERGTKTVLAKFIGVPLPKVSQWLSGTFEPGGETTLRLLHWVEQQERQK